jgi:hypothetical protein
MIVIVIECAIGSSGPVSAGWMRGTAMAGREGSRSAERLKIREKEKDKEERERWRGQ